MKVVVSLFLCLASFALLAEPADKDTFIPLYYGMYGGRLISESGRMDRDLTLLKMRQNAGFYPGLIVGGDTVLVADYPKLDNQPLYLFDDISGALQNLRINGMVNFGELAFAQVNYQINSQTLLDAFVTMGNLDKSPYYLTVGRQYIPYGDFNKYDVDANPLNKTVFRLLKPATTFSAYFDNWDLRASFYHNDVGPEQGVVVGVRRGFPIDNGFFKLGLGYNSNAKNMTKVLRSFELASGNTLPVYDVFAILNYKKMDFRVEITQALRPFKTARYLGAYDIEGEYRLLLFNRPSKLVLAHSGLFNTGGIDANPVYEQLGLFNRQYVASVKHQLKKHMTLGFSIIFGKTNQNRFEKQAVMNFIYKI